MMMAMMLRISAEHIDSNIEASNQQSKNNAYVRMQLVYFCRDDSFIFCRVVPVN